MFCRKKAWFPPSKVCSVTTPSTLTVWPTYGELNAPPVYESGTEPCTAPIVRIVGGAVTDRLTLHDALCGVVSSFVAVIVIV